jgi:AcrR family transcriptional regulator
MRLAAPARRLKLQTAALELFSQQGYRGTTTQAIAHHAGVSEALLFRHFPTKEELYWSVLEQQCAVRGGRARLDAILSAGGEDAEVFAAIAEDLLSRNFADSRLYRLLLFSALENHELSHRFFRTYISNYYDAVAAHIRQRIATGGFRSVDPLLSARLFIGMVLHYFLVQDVFRGNQQHEYDLKQVCRTVAQIWLGGVKLDAVPVDAAVPADSPGVLAAAHSADGPTSKAVRKSSISVRATEEIRSAKTSQKAESLSR